MAILQDLINPLKFGRKIRCLGWKDKRTYLFLLKGSAIQDAVNGEIVKMANSTNNGITITPAIEVVTVLVNNILMEYRDGEIYPANLNEAELSRSDWVVVPLADEKPKLKLYQTTWSDHV